MTRYHFDANPIVDLLRGKFASVQRRLDQVDRNALSVSFVVVGELRLGIEKSGDANEALKVQGILRLFARVGIDETIADEYARLRAHPERIGQRLNGNDLWLAATALAEGATLVTADEAFDRVPGLKTESWRV